MAVNTVGENMRRLRIAFGETQEQLGDYLGYSKSAINMMEKGERDVSVDVLKKLSQHYFSAMSDLTEKAYSEGIDWKKVNIIQPDPEETALRILPITIPDTEDMPPCFLDAVNLHKRIIHDYYAENRPEEKDALDEMDICREKYLAAIQYESVRMYTKANLVSLMLFCAKEMIVTIYSKDLPIPFLGKIYNEPQEVGKIYKENKANFDMAMTVLRKEFISGVTGKYINDLAEDPEFADLADYYKLLVQTMNLVPNNAGIVENANRATPLIEKLIMDGNPYMLDYLSILLEVFE